MTIFVWDDTLSVGHPFIDIDHRHLVDLVNHLYDEIENGRGQDVAGAVLDELIVYTQEHFKREENVMQKMNYEESAPHKRAHQDLTEKVISLREMLIQGNPNLAVELLVFLYSLLFNHIMQNDQMLGRAIRASHSKPTLDA